MRKPTPPARSRRKHTRKPKPVAVDFDFYYPSIVTPSEPQPKLATFTAADVQEASNIAANEERQAVIALLEATAASLLGPLGVALQDGRFMGQLTPELILEHVKALTQSAERVRRGDHRH